MSYPSSTQMNLYSNWLNQLAVKLAGVGIGRDSEQWNRYLKGKFLRELLCDQSQEYADFYGSADIEIKKVNKQERNKAKALVLDALCIGWLTEENMAVFLGQIEQFILYEYDLLVDTPEWAVGVYERIIPIAEERDGG